MVKESVYEVVEVCPHCASENLWRDLDVVKEGYKTTCNECGAEMMLCDECLHADDNPCQKCDWHKVDGRGVCFRGVTNS